MDLFELILESEQIFFESFIGTNLRSFLFCPSASCIEAHSILFHEKGDD